MIKLVQYFLVILLCKHVIADVCDVSENLRFDCFPESYANEKDCLNRGCCWRAAENAPLDTPYCYYGSKNFGYEVTDKKETDTGFQLELSLKGPGGPYGGNIEKLYADFYFETASRIRVKIYDAENSRYEVPIETPKVTTKAQNPQYEVSYESYPFGFAVIRKSDNLTIFNTNVGGFVFSDQFLQISSVLPSENIYGLGEHVLGLKLDTKWSLLSLFARDIATPEGGVNLYGVHPFYMNLEKSGNANGVFLKNSNAMDIVLQPSPAITYRTIGGILDFYIFLGPTPSDVSQQYSEIVGKPTMPPYWSLGFHLCRYGYNTIENMQMVRKRMDENGIPQDVQWNDIDYMDSYRDFTIDQKKFHGLSEYVDELKSKGMHYILMTDPAISNTLPGYKPYEEGLKSNVFIKDENGDVLVGKVWPGLTVYPDFFHPNASEYWFNQINEFHKTINFDGMWIDMNEPSNFVQGSTNGCSQNKYDHPPYIPGIIDGYLASKTVCMNAKHAIGRHYDLHSLYGYSESVATMNAMKKIRGKRTLIITRSSYSGTGHHAGHWLGDNHSLWEDLYRSIAGMLNFNIFSIPMVGADICGFLGDTTEELCSRWMQLGAFYPFSRNHNSLGQRDQDPAAFGEQLITASKGALSVRYQLLPYLYTLFYVAHLEGRTVARPLFFEFPKDSKTYGIDKQFMWGSGLLISPVVTQGAKSVDAWFPDSRWYDFYTGSILESSGQTVNLPASFERVNLHIRGGVVIPMQQSGMTTTQTRKSPYSLLVALDRTSEANGYLFIDDGESLLDNGDKNTTLVEFTSSNSQLTIQSMRKGFVPENHQLSIIAIYGVEREVKSVQCNGHAQTFTYDSEHKALRATLSGISILDNNKVTWSY